jgi:hypothetical protein
MEQDVPPVQGVIHERNRDCRSERTRHVRRDTPRVFLREPGEPRDDRALDTRHDYGRHCTDREIADHATRARLDRTP